MCGIFGLIGNHNSLDITAPLNSIKHRGPDDSGIYKDKNVILGFRRLSIIDLSKDGNQPMFNEDNTIGIVFNGEIYNFKELRKSLEISHKFKSKTDSEVLIHGYEEWGIEKLLKKLNGMFAFCIYDKRDASCYLVRDRIGKKPLYYFKNDKYIAFSSEVKAFKKLDDVKFTLNTTYMDLFMGFSFLPDNESTIINNVYKITPGSYLKIFSDLNIKKYIYWDFNNIAKKVNEDTENILATKLEDLLLDSVNKRLVADVSVGILLSGGLDSSLITALAAKSSSEKIKTINISFKDSCVDERNFARITAKHCNTDHQELNLKVVDIYNTFKESIWIYDDLSTVDGGLFSEYLLAKELQKAGIKVALVGEGADEVFGGYTWFQLSQYPFRILPQRLISMGYYYAIMRMMPTNKNFLKYSSFINNKMNLVDDDSFKKIQNFEAKYSLPNHYCMKVDRGMSAASLEARAPFLDYRVVEFANSIPSKFLLKGDCYSPKSINEKYLLRRVAEKYLPEEISFRKKKGGMLPVNDLLNTGLREDASLIYANPYLGEYYGKGYLKNIIESSPSNVLKIWEREWILWKCLLFSLWHDYYID